jgi:hypothetical protein
MAQPVIVGGVLPAVAVPPQPAFAADPDTITAWLLDDTAAETADDISREMERGFNRLVDNVPAAVDAGYEEAMRGMTDEIVHSDTMVAYLVATNTPHGEVRITVIHSIARYSAGFGGSNALHGHTLALLGEMVDGQLPTLVKFDQDPQEDLAHALAVESVTVPPPAAVDAYYATATDDLQHFSSDFLLHWAWGSPD